MFAFRVGAEKFSVLQSVATDTGLTQSHNKFVSGNFPLETKRPVHEGDHIASGTIAALSHIFYGVRGKTSSVNEWGIGLYSTGVDDMGGAYCVDERKENICGKLNMEIILML